MSKKLDSPRAASLRTGDPSTAVDLTIAVWPSADLLMSLLAVVDKTAQRSLDVRNGWRTRAVELGDDFVDRLDPFGRETWINLLGLVADEPAARTASGLVETATEMDPRALLRYLTGYYRRVYRRETPAAVMEAAIEGDVAARREFRRTSFPHLPYWRDALRHMLAREPEAIRAEVAQLLGQWATDVYGPTEAEFIEVAERSVAGFRRSTEGLPVEQVVERAAPGLTFVPEAGQTSVILLPSVAVRPLWAVADHRTANVFAFPAPVPEGEQPGPPVRLVALGRAIGDETRLRILRELATQPATPPDLADRMGIPRTSLLHHLRILRDADLIAVHVHDSAYHQYHVRDEHFGEIERLLEDYLG